MPMPEVSVVSERDPGFAAAVTLRIALLVPSSRSVLRTFNDWPRTAYDALRVNRPAWLDVYA